MNRNSFFFICLVLITLVSLPLVSAAPVTDLNIILFNPPAIANKDLNFQANWTGGDVNVLYWQFDVDGNTTINSTGDTNTIFTGTFGDISGTETIVDVNINQENLTVFEFQAIMMWRGSNIGTFSYGDGPVLGTVFGYVIQADPGAQNIILTRFDGTGGPGTLLVDGGFQPTNDVNYLVKFTRNSSNVMELFIDGDSKGTTTDSTYTDFNTFVGQSTNMSINEIVLTNTPLTALVPPEFQVHNFSTTGAKQIILTVQNLDGNTTAVLDLNINGSLNITVFDENTLAPINGASIDFNSGTYTTGIDGNVSIPLAGLTTGEFTITIDVNAAYLQRQFIFDLNQNSSTDLNLLMLQTVHGSSRDFKFFQPNETTPITNSMIEWQRTDGIDNGIAQKTRTNTSGELTFFGQQDANYTLQITDTVSDVNRTYTGTLLTIKKPLDASDLVTELTPFSVIVGGLAVQSFTGLTDDLVFRIYSDTVDFYSISVDFNADYFGTSKNIQTKGGAATEEFQPYLIAKTGNIEATIFTINNPRGRVTVGGIRIDSFTDISGVSTLVESKFSDGTGQAIFHFITGQEYTLNFYDSDGVLLMSQTIEANNTQYFAYLELGTLDLTPTTFLIVAVDWHPVLGGVVPTDGNVSFWQLLRPQNGTIGDVNVFISHISDSNIVFNQVFTVNSATDFNLSFDLNVAGFNDSFPLKISLQIFDNGSNQIGAIRTKSYSFKDTGFKQATERGKDALGQFGVTLASLIIVVALFSFLTSKEIEANNNRIVIPIMLSTLVFAFIGWITWDIYASGVLFGIGYGLWSVKK